MKIIVDMMGGDNAPLAVLEGAAAAVKEYGVQLSGGGDEALVRKTAAGGGNRESLLGQRPARRAQCAADAGCRNPALSSEARLRGLTFFIRRSQ